MCPYDCPSMCGFYAETEGGRLTGVSGDPGHPAARGRLCGKMRHYELSVNSGERILTPLVRTGKKGEGVFRRASFGECAELIARRWKEILGESGPDAIAHYYGSGTVTPIQRMCGTAFFNYMGACELVHTLCCAAKGAGYEEVLGKTGCLDPRELQSSDLYLVWGCSVAATRFPSLQTLAEGRRQGKKVITIEVYGGQMHNLSDEVILLRPGSDGALALAMMHVLVRDGLADEAYLEKWGRGYPEFRRTLDAYTPGWAEKITGVPAEKIVGLSHLYAEASAPAILLGSGVSRCRSGGMNCRLITLLTMFTASWEKEGGGLCGCDPSEADWIDTDMITRPDLRTREGRTININQLGEAISDPAIRSLYVYAGNPANTVSDANAVMRGLLREDLFTVVHERFMTDTAKCADVVLPATFSVEQSDFYAPYGYRILSAGYRCVDPPGECRSNWDTFRALAEAMGWDEPFFRQTEEELMRAVLDRPVPAVLALPEEIRAQVEELKERSGTVSFPFGDHLSWKTRDGFFRVVSDDPEHPVPEYFPPYGGEEDLQLVSVPGILTLNGIFTERPDIREKTGAREIILNTEDAEERGIADGDAVLAENELGQVRFTARVTDRIARGAAAVVGVHRQERGDASSMQVPNALHHARLSDLAAATTMNDNTVNVRKL